MEYRVADNTPASAQAWANQARTEPGSWWPHWDAWLAERCGSTKPAPRTLGNTVHKPLGRAPGTYVLAS